MTLFNENGDRIWIYTIYFGSEYEGSTAYFYSKKELSKREAELFILEIEEKNELIRKKNLTELVKNPHYEYSYCLNIEDELIHKFELEPLEEEFCLN